MLLRWEAGEQNRTLFAPGKPPNWSWAWRCSSCCCSAARRASISLSLALLLLVVVIVQRFLLTPMMMSLGRLIDFIPVSVRSPDRVKFQVLHMGYAGWKPASVWSGWCSPAKLLMRSRRKSGQAAGDIDVVDKAYHRHVNR